MKTKIFIMLAVIISFAGMSEIKAQDTLWTRITGSSSWAGFTKDGTKILFNFYNSNSKLNTQLLTADSGRVIWTDSILHYGIGLMSPDSVSFISFVDDTTIALRRLSDGVEIKKFDTLFTHNYPIPYTFYWGIESAVFSNNGRYLFVCTSDYDGSHNKTTKKVFYKIDLLKDQLVFIRIDSSLNMDFVQPNDNRIIIWKSHGISFYDTDSLKEQKFYNDGPIYQLSRSGRYITSVHYPADIYTWDTQCDSIIRRNHLDSLELFSLAYTNNDSIIMIKALTSDFAKIIFFNVFSGQRIIDFNNDFNYNNSLATFELSPDETKLLIVGMNGIYMYPFSLFPTAKKDKETPQAILQVNPNPSLETVGINFVLINSSVANLSLYDSNGEFVMVLANKYFDAGKNQISFSSKYLANGMYFIKITGNSLSQTTKLIISK